MCWPVAVSPRNTALGCCASPGRSAPRGRHRGPERPIGASFPFSFGDRLQPRATASWPSMPPSASGRFWFRRGTGSHQVRSWRAWIRCGSMPLWARQGPDARPRPRSRHGSRPAADPKRSVMVRPRLLPCRPAPAVPRSPNEGLPKLAAQKLSPRRRSIRRAPPRTQPSG